jgi:hypothetical protein
MRDSARIRIVARMYRRVRDPFLFGGIENPGRSLILIVAGTPAPENGNSFIIDHLRAATATTTTNYGNYNAGDCATRAICGCFYLFNEPAG